MRRATLICSSALWEYGHGEAHPLRPVRLKMTYELLQAFGAFDGEHSWVSEPRLATDDELALWHTDRYIDAVKRLTKGDKSVNPWAYRFGPGDNPVFEEMYETEALKVGASLIAAQMVAGNEADVAFSFGGGLHHAMAGHASGFCVFNDAAVAVRWLVEQGLRVVYVDIDAHHGDGVQAAFYDTDQVMTISLHESGEYLFPGTGFIHELGQGKGKGYSVNIPFLPYTEDDVYLWAFEKIVPPLIQDFGPDVLVTQLGADSHFQDPLAHLQLTTYGYAAMFQAFHDLSLPWVALGGGGYNVGAVARIWTIAYGMMSEQILSDEIPASFAQNYNLHHLRDRAKPQHSRRERALCREHAEVQISELERLLSRL
ncbi:MAG: acetoin utilization protein AcuC [Anaerolineae bacterium]|nr:acetoin utilization protein AcuC [Anaerolineae bacterium]